MPTLVYKRTHDGDPDYRGVFGVEGCMGQVRGYDFDSVIGIGGVGAWAKQCGIDEKINWIGLGKFQVGKCFRGYPKLAFEHFALFEDEGESAWKAAPALAERFCHPNSPRFAIYEFSKKELAEIDKLLRSVRKNPPSRVMGGKESGTKRKCPPKHRHKC